MQFGPRNPPKRKNKNLLMQHVRQPARASSLFHEFLAKNSVVMVPQPFYSVDIVPCYFSVPVPVPKTEEGQERKTLRQDFGNRRRG